MKRIILIGLATVCWFGFAGAVQGQEQPMHTMPCPLPMVGLGPECMVMHAGLFEQGGPPEPPFSPPGGGMRRRHLEQFRMLKLLELLDLNEEQEMKFLVEFRALREKQVVLQKERQDAVTQLAEGLRADTLSEETIARLTDRIFELRRTYAAENEGFYERVRPILTAEQAGKLVVFQERFEHELLDQVRSFRERRGAGGSPSDDSEE